MCWWQIIYVENLLKITIDFVYVYIFQWKKKNSLILFRQAISMNYLNEIELLISSSNLQRHKESTGSFLCALIIFSAKYSLLYKNRLKLLLSRRRNILNGNSKYFFNHVLFTVTILIVKNQFSSWIYRNLAVIFGLNVPQVWFWSLMKGLGPCYQL